MGKITTKFTKNKMAKTNQKAKFKRAAKKCKGKKIKAFRACMKRELKKKK